MVLPLPLKAGPRATSLSGPARLPWPAMRPRSCRRISSAAPKLSIASQCETNPARARLPGRCSAVGDVKSQRHWTRRRPDAAVASLAVVECRRAGHAPSCRQSARMRNSVRGIRNFAIAVKRDHALAPHSPRTSPDFGRAHNRHARACHCKAMRIGIRPVPVARVRNVLGDCQNGTGCTNCSMC
jgi:hypothetical protein